MPKTRTKAARRPRASSAQVLKRMKSTRRRDTPGELALRSILHSMGFRYRIDLTIPGTRRRPDILFKKARLAVYVDGCFWHGCPVHGSWPKLNGAWWREKIEANKARDRDTILELTAAGWKVLRFWEHTSPALAARRVARELKR
jgi:DNA mismatch endonuclease (patch repair protein)